MADLIINKPTCAAVAEGNTGVPSCFQNIGKITGLILVDKTTTFTPAEVAAFKTTLQTAVLTAGSGRVYPIFRFVEVADNSEDETISTTGYGNKEVANDGSYDWTFRFINGGMCLNAHLRKFNSSDKKIMLVDDSNVVYGTLDSTGNVNGLSGRIYTKKLKINDGSNATQYGVRVMLDKPEELNDAPAFVVCDFNIENEILGNLDVQLTEVETALGVATISLQTMCGKVDLYDQYADILDDISLWTVTKAGAAVTITSVTKDAVNKAWDIAFTGTGIHEINLAAPSVLAAAGFGGYPENGYEGIALEVTMPVS